MRSHFLAGAHVVLESLCLPAVAEAWDQPSILADQTVGSLCGHLARGSIWVVADYLALDEPAAVTFETADDYVVAIVGNLTAKDHRNIRQRGAEQAAIGHDALIAKASEQLAALEQQLTSERSDRVISVFGGLSMRLDPYLDTRLLEQVVHLDDLVRSVDAEFPAMPTANIEIVLDIGTRIGLRRFGPTTMIGGMFRGLPGAFPVL